MPCLLLHAIYLPNSGSSRSIQGQATAQSLKPLNISEVATGIGAGKVMKRKRETGNCSSQIDTMCHLESRKPAPFLDTYGRNAWSERSLWPGRTLRTLPIPPRPPGVWGYCRAPDKPAGTLHTSGFRRSLSTPAASCRPGTPECREGLGGSCSPFYAKEKIQSAHQPRFTTESRRNSKSAADLHRSTRIAPRVLNFLSPHRCDP